MTIEEAKNIINRTDWRHEAYYRNDPATVKAVNESFSREHPGVVDLEDASIVEAMAKALNLPPPGEINWFNLPKPKG